MNTVSPNAESITRQWHLIDADGQTLGRLATEVANIIRGKNKPEFTPHVDCGDFVIVINAEKIKTTGKKDIQKVYHRHSGFPGGHKQETLGALRQRKPEAVIEKAVKGMLPHTRLGDHQFTKLNVYAGPDHPHEAQQPKPYKLER
ncbi:MAG TPA: 50S ribosomal protein L13 [Drouetiella sp.]